MSESALSAGQTESAGPTRRELGAAAHLESTEARRSHFLKLFDFSRGRGLEIGPLDSGIAAPEQHDVRYVDVFDAERIRAHYAEDPGVIPELVPEIDYWLIDDDGLTRTLSEAARPGAPYDWVIASHVIEHVPDLIGWLREIASITKDGGALVLAVPDRRYSFDRHRPPTTTGQALEAHEGAHSRPSIRAVYDFCRSAVAVDTVALWEGVRPPGREAAMFDDAGIRASLDRVRAGEYVDCHVWTFTARGFVQQLAELREFGLCDWYVERLDVPKNSVEFHAILRKLPSGHESDSVEFSEVHASRDLPDWLEDEWLAQERTRVLEAEVKVLRRRNRRLSSRLDALERSARFRVGKALVAPLGAVRRRLRPPR